MIGVAACALLGLVVGIGLDAVIDRVPAREPLLPLRFRCPHRARVPAEADDGAEGPGPGEGDPAVPPPAATPPREGRESPALAVWLRPGRPCPGCGAPVPWWYLAVPAATAVLFAAAAVRFGADWALPGYLLFFAALVAVSVIDLQLQIIPNRVVYPAIFASLPLLVLAAVGTGGTAPLLRALGGGAAAWTALLVIHLVSPGGMGFGDVRLSFLLGLWLGWLSWGHVVSGLFFGFLLGAVTGLALVALRLRKRTDHVPFGPFLAAGAVLAVLFGGPFVDAWS